MNDALYWLLNRERSREVTIRGQALRLTLLTAQELLEIRFAGDKEEDDFSKALYTGAALVAKSLRQDGAPVFESAEDVLTALSAEEINGAVAAYHSWSREIDPGFDSGEETIAALKKG